MNTHSIKQVKGRIFTSQKIEALAKIQPLLLPGLPLYYPVLTSHNNYLDVYTQYSKVYAY